MTLMPHLAALSWDEDDRLRSTARQAAGTGTPKTAHYAYDGGGQRVRKVTDRPASAGEAATRKTERIYLGVIELYREYASDGSTITLGRETLHATDADTAMALVETRIAGTDKAPAQVVRYQHDNHLGSSVLELDDQAGIISYEEYFPFGSTSYQAVSAQVELPKRYRYTGKERDEENDLYYHGNRYYAPWLGRWTAADPAGLSAGMNLYAYVRNRPTGRVDPQGTDDQPGWLSRAAAWTGSKIGPSSWIGQKISHSDYLGSSIIQDDSKLAAAQLGAEAITIAAATVATGGLAAEATAGLMTGAGATGLETAIVSGATGNVAGGAMFRYGVAGAASGSIREGLKAAADPSAITKDAVTGAATAGLLYGAAGAGQASGARSAGAPRGTGVGPPKSTGGEPVPKVVSQENPAAQVEPAPAVQAQTPAGPPAVETQPQAPIVGKGQRTGGPMHAADSERYGRELSTSPGVTKVFLNKAISTITKDLPTGKIPSPLRPDTAATTVEGKVIMVEVPSPSDVLVGRSTNASLTKRALINKNLKLQLRIGDASEGLYIMGATPEQAAPVFNILNVKF